MPQMSSIFIIIFTFISFFAFPTHSQEIEIVSRHEAVERIAKILYNVPKFALLELNEEDFLDKIISETDETQMLPGFSEFKTRMYQKVYAQDYDNIDAHESCDFTFKLNTRLDFNPFNDFRAMLEKEGLFPRRYHWPYRISIRTFGNTIAVQSMHYLVPLFNLRPCVTSPSIFERSFDWLKMKLTWRINPFD